MKNKHPLSRVTVGFRCPMDWEAMEGDEGKRFCEKCRKDVVDLSAMTMEEAEHFVRQHGAAGSACVRLQRRADGSLVTKGCPKTERGKMVRGVMAGVAAGVVLSSCASQSEAGGVAGPAGAPAGFADAPGETGGAVERDPFVVGLICLPESDDERR